MFPSYDDQNIFMTAIDGKESYVLKIHNLTKNDQNISHLDVQNEVMTKLIEEGTLRCFLLALTEQYSVLILYGGFFFPKTRYTSNLIFTSLSSFC